MSAREPRRQRSSSRNSPEYRRQERRRSFSPAGRYRKRRGSPRCAPENHKRDQRDDRRRRRGRERDRSSSYDRSRDGADAEFISDEDIQAENYQDLYVRTLNVCMASFMVHENSRGNVLVLTYAVIQKVGFCKVSILLFEFGMESVQLLLMFSSKIMGVSFVFAVVV